MYEEQRLISFGYPLEDALTLCHSLRREGLLEKFIEEEEKSIKDQNERILAV